jgi:multidrug transporter EmrE-like cation transporter
MVTFKMNWPLFIGLLVTFIGLAMTAIGLMLQKYAHNKRMLQKEDERQNYFTSKWWWIGMTVFCIGNLVFWAVLALVPQVVLACWQCWAMIITILLAPVILGEMVTMGKLINVMVIVFGVVWVVMASPAQYEEYSSEQFWAAIHDVVFLSITGGMLILFIVLIASQWWTLKDKLSALRYILIAAIINWYSVLSARCSSGFFLSTVVHQNQGIGFEFWCMLGCMLACAGANVHFLNKALECDKAIFVVPIYESLAISGQILFGIVFFREFDDLNMYQTLNISFAIGVVIGGVLLSSVKEPDTPFLTQVVISEELCGCCFCCGSLKDIDESMSSDEEQPLCASPRSSARQAASDPGPQTEAQERGYRRPSTQGQGLGARSISQQGPRGDGGPRDPRGAPRNGRNESK